MIYDLLSSFKEMGNPNVLAAASYTLKEGLYMLFDEEGHKEILIDKGEYTGEFFELIRSLDFYSSLIEMNKPVDSQKKIHTNNIYSVSFKYYDPEKDDKKEIKKNPVNIYDASNMEEHVNRYFESLEKWYVSYKGILKTTSVKPPDKNLLEKNKKIFLTNIPTVIELVKQYKLKPGKYIKMFISAPVSEYKAASDLYLIPKIFNNNDDSIDINGQIFGVSNANMSLNSKKPFLGHKSTPYVVPYRITFEQALETYRLMLWLEAQNIDGKPMDSGYLLNEPNDSYTLHEKIHGNTTAQFVHLQRGKVLIVDDYDMLPQARKDLLKPFKQRNYLNLEKYNSMIITEMSKFEEVVDNILFNGCLVRNYYNDPSPKKDILSTRQAAIIQLSKQAFISFFRKSDDKAIKPLIDKISLEMILEKLKQINPTPKQSVQKSKQTGQKPKQTGRIRLENTTFAKAINLRFALLEYFKVGGKEKLGITVMDVYEKLKEKVLQDKPKGPVLCDTDEEFYFAVGQLMRFLVSLSKAQNINYSFINPILKAKDNSKIKREIASLIGKYDYDIVVLRGQSRNRFDNLQSIVNSYTNDSQQVSVDMILAGFASPNIVYFKKEEEETK